MKTQSLYNVWGWQYLTDRAAVQNKNMNNHVIIHQPMVASICVSNTITSPSEHLLQFIKQQNNAIGQGQTKL